MMVHAAEVEGKNPWQNFWLWSSSLGKMFENEITL